MTDNNSAIWQKMSEEFKEYLKRTSWVFLNYETNKLDTLLEKPETMKNLEEFVLGTKYN